MNTKNKENLIGYDPLAWMNETPESESSNKGDDTTFEEITPSITQQESQETEPVVVESADDDEEAWIESGADNAKIILEATLNIQNVTKLHDSLLKAITDHDNLEIDASAVTAVDTASLQLLVVLKQESIKLNKDLSFDFPSDKFIEAAELLGIDELLGVNHAAAGLF